MMIKFLNVKDVLVHINRNLIGRQGKGSYNPSCILSPQTVTASAVMGKICSVDKLNKEL